MIAASPRSRLRGNSTGTVTAAGSTSPRWRVGLPQERNLERAELRALAAQIADDRDEWAHLVRHDPDRRNCVQLHRDRYLDVWLLCWSHQQETGLHDHDLSSGAVHVCDGWLVEDRLELRDHSLRRTSVERAEGFTFDFDSSHVHCVRHPLGAPAAVSIHVYSPALLRMGYYEIGEDGLLHRSSMSYAEEIAA